MMSSEEGALLAECVGACVNPASRSILEAAEALVECGNELFWRRAQDDTDLLLAL